MNRISRFRPELVDDVAKARRYYEEQSEGLGSRFLKSYCAAIATAERDLEIHLRAQGEFRRVLLARFPYALYLRIEEYSLVFILLFPAVRNPRFLTTKLRSRDE